MTAKHDFSWSWNCSGSATAPSPLVRSAPSSGLLHLRIHPVKRGGPSRYGGEPARGHTADRTGGWPTFRRSQPMSCRTLSPSAKGTKLGSISCEVRLMRGRRRPAVLSARTTSRLVTSTAPSSIAIRRKCELMW